MNRELLRKVVRRISPMTREVLVEGYSKEEVEEVINELIAQKIIKPSQGITYMADPRGGRIVKEGKEIEFGYDIWEFELKNKYKMDRMGKDAI